MGAHFWGQIAATVAILWLMRRAIDLSLVALGLRLAVGQEPSFGWVCAAITANLIASGFIVWVIWL